MNAYKKYLSTRPPASADSNKRIKLIKFFALTALDDFEFGDGDSKEEKKVDLKLDLIARMKNYRPSGVGSYIHIHKSNNPKRIHSINGLILFQTVFELNPNQKSVQVQVMKNKRREHGSIIANFQKTQQQIETDKLLSRPENVSTQ